MVKRLFIRSEWRRQPVDRTLFRLKSYLENCIEQDAKLFMLDAQDRCKGDSPPFLYFASAGGAGAGITLKVEMRIFQAAPSRTATLER